MAEQVESLLTFWFGEQRDGFADGPHRDRWFSGGADFDETCRAQFGTLAALAADGELDDWLSQPRSRLAYILLCDQIPRNIYRGEALAFATDGAALNASRTGIENGMDRSLTFDERCFFYLPFEHSESLVNQHTCVGLFSDLHDQTPEGFRHHTGNYLRFAHQHRDILKRFGRFPHRNGTLGRTSTAEEIEFLREGPTFGQASG